MELKVVCGYGEHKVPSNNSTAVCPEIALSTQFCTEKQLARNI